MDIVVVSSSVGWKEISSSLLGLVVTSLQFADDTMFCLDNENFLPLHHMVGFCFEAMPRLKIIGVSALSWVSTVIRISLEGGQV